MLRFFSLGQHFGVAMTCLTCTVKEHLLFEVLHQSECHVPLELSLAKSLTSENVFFFCALCAGSGIPSVWRSRLQGSASDGEEPCTCIASPKKMIAFGCHSGDIPTKSSLSVCSSIPAIKINQKGKVLLQCCEENSRCDPQRGSRRYYREGS